MRFAVIRHPDLPDLGTCPESALDIHRAAGWFRVSEWRAGPEYFHLPDFADALEDLDPVEPEDEAFIPEGGDSGQSMSVLSDATPEADQAEQEPADEASPESEAASAGPAKRKPRKEQSA